MTFEMYFGLDPENAGCVCFSTEDGDSGGWKPRRVPSTVNGWLRLAKRSRKVTLPVAVRRARLSWDSADVRPDGWTPAAELAPNGVRFVWEVK
jgi:hypothetical protein